jgi:glycosyltransferase involved in cell wall biosynthesis
MRLLHIGPLYLPAIGGGEKYLADLSEELVQRGHQVDVFTSRALDYHTWQDELAPFEQINGVNVYRFRCVPRREWVWRVLHYGLSNYWRTRSRRYEPFIFFGGGPLAPGLLWAMLTRGRRYDLIHLSNLVYSHVAYGYWAARRLGVPVVITAHAHAEQEATYNIGYQHEVMRGADHVIAVTPAERDMFIRLGVDPWRVSISGNGLKLAEYENGLKWDQATARRRLGLPTDGFMMLFLGRKANYKGLDLALDAYVALLSQYPEAHFLAVGPETDYSRALWSRYPARPGLHVLGAVSDEDKLAALQACDCLVLPSTGEAFGIVFLEAWMMGKPVVGARVLSVSSVIHEEQDGLLIAPGNSADLAACVARLAADPELARRLGANGRAKMLSRYTTARIADRVEGIYLRTLRWRRREKESRR